MACPPCLEVFTSRDGSTSRIEHIHVEIRVGSCPAVIPSQLECAEETIRPCRVPLVIPMKLDVSVAISVGVPTQPSGSVPVSCGVHPRNAALYCPIHAPKRAVFARRRPVPGTIESPRQRLVDDFHPLGNHPIHRILQISGRVRIGDIQGYVRRHVYDGFCNPRPVNTSPTVIRIVGNPRERIASRPGNPR